MSQFYLKVTEPARKLEAELGLPGGFLEGLQQEDDWSFLVKIHALVEAAATHALTVRTGIVSATEFFSRLELSAEKTGKVALAEALGMLTSEERRFIRSLSEIRNVLVHDVKNVGINFVEYFSALPKDKRKQYAKAFCYVDFDRPNDEISEADAVKRLLAEPKRAIWSAAVFIVAVLQLQADTARLQRDAGGYMKDAAGYMKQVASAWRPN